MKTKDLIAKKYISEHALKVIYIKEYMAIKDNWLRSITIKNKMKRELEIFFFNLS